MSTCESNRKTMGRVTRRAKRDTKHDTRRTALRDWGKRAVVALCCCATTLQVAHADINAEMSRFFNSSNTLSNATGPGAYRAQGMNVYAGGELQVRTPVRTYQMLSYSLPSVRAGCGGIDAYLGSFSHINSQQFRAMLEQIGDATVGLLFKAALAAINPLIESKLAELQAIIGEQGIFSRNSCQMANSLVNGLSASTGVSSSSSCQAMARAIYDEDDAAAAARCGGSIASVNQTARESGDRDLQALAKRDVNLMWDALRNTTYTRGEKEMLLNIAGSVLLFSSPENSDPRTPLYLEPTIDTLQVFMHGHEASPTQPGQVVLRNYWRCQSVDCMSPTRENMEIMPFAARIEAQLRGIAVKMQNREPLDVDDVALISRTSIPVHRMLSVGYQAGSNAGVDIQELFIRKYADVIALNYAHGFLVQALKNARVYLAAAEMMGTLEAKLSKEIRANIDRMTDALDNEQANVLRKKSDIEVIVQSMERYERSMRQSLAGPQRTMLDFGALMSGKAGRG